jgi:hypothetical protein
VFTASTPPDDTRHGRRYVGTSCGCNASGGALGLLLAAALGLLRRRGLRE